MFKFRVFIRALLTSYLEISLAVFLNLTDIKYHNVTEVFASLLSYIIVAIFVSFFLISWVLLYHLKWKQGDEKYAQMFDALFKDFKPYKPKALSCKAFLYRFFYLQFLIRRIAIAAIIVFLLNYPTI